MSKKGTLKQADRLNKARKWLHEFEGKNIIKSYRKRFKVDVYCAIGDLEKMGVKLSAKAKKSRIRSAEGLAKHRRRLKEKKESGPEYLVDYDEHFSYIAGYTSGGFAYGIPWDEDEDEIPF